MRRVKDTDGNCRRRFIAGGVSLKRIAVYFLLLLAVTIVISALAADVEVKPETNSTTTFQVQKADGTPVLNVDTSNERVGIGTATPDSQVEIVGATDQAVPVLHLVEEDGHSGHVFRVDSFEDVPIFVIGTGALVGIGDATPDYKLDIEGGDIAIQTGKKIILDSDDNADSGILHSNAFNRVAIYVDANEVARFLAGGQIYADASRPSGVTSATLGLFDIAEEIPVLGDDVEAGDVVVIDEENDVMVHKSETAYDAKVAGVISTSPSYLIKVFNDESYGLPLSLAGRAFCKADASYGAIARGDLLVTSPTAGHAMKFSLLDISEAKSLEELKEILIENEKRRSSILGKALVPLKSGKGKIMILITLQ
ncbi:hypothetical protein KAT51_06400 [bacterium]|nr:hypothetical protein [bacterium]